MRQTAKQKIIHHTILLLEEYPFEALTIKMICAHSQVNRSTFYEYFLDKYDLISSIQNYHLRKYHRLLNSLYYSIKPERNSEERIYQFFKIILKYIKRNYQFFHAILVTFPNRSLFHEYVMQTKETYTHILDDYAQNVQSKKHYVTYAIGGQMGVLYYWIREECVEEPEDLAQILLSNTMKLQK